MDVEEDNDGRKEEMKDEMMPSDSAPVVEPAPNATSGPMASFEPLIKEFERLPKRQKQMAKSIGEQVDTILTTLKKTRTILGASLAGQSTHQLSEESMHHCVLAMEKLDGKVKETKQVINDAQKEYYNALSKYDKAIDKRFKADLSLASDTTAMNGKAGALNQAIANHLIRQGKFEYADTFSKEAGMTYPEETTKAFVRMFDLLNALQRKELASVIQWASSQREALQRKGSHLEFALHRLQYLLYIAANDRQQALSYAKDHLNRFRSTHAKDVDKLMTCMLWLGRTEKSPYADLLSPAHWASIELAFRRDYCTLLGMPSESPLYLAATVGATALPTILKMAAVMRDKKLMWSEQNELPVEIQLPRSLQFHSLFACPVSKEIGSDENPPMMLPCGHVICKGSLDRLSKGVKNVRLKCPYCPMDSTPMQAIRVHF